MNLIKNYLEVNIMTEDKKISCSLSMRESIWRQVKSYQDEFTAKFGSKPSTAPLVEQFYNEEILPFLNYCKQNNRFPSLLQFNEFKKQILEVES